MERAEKGGSFIDTPRGRIWVREKADLDCIASLQLDEGMGSFAAPHYPPSRELKALKRIAEGGEGNVIVAYTEDGKIVGFVAIAPPSAAERWGKLSGKGLIEAMAIEVSRGWRSMGIANKMMQSGLSDPFFDDKIVICTGYTWHWDLGSSALTKKDYRRMLLRYLEKAGFEYYETDEPNVALDTYNFLTARIGPRVGSELNDRFKQLLFKEQNRDDSRRQPRTIRDVLGEDVGDRAED
jgi:acetoin utilization protein AcuA